MSAKPGKIHKVIENNLPYPRSKTSESFQKFERKYYSSLSMED